MKAIVNARTLLILQAAAVLAVSCSKGPVDTPKPGFELVE
jgi:hypothetical protein